MTMHQTTHLMLEYTSRIRWGFKENLCRSVRTIEVYVAVQRVT